MNLTCFWRDLRGRRSVGVREGRPGRPKVGVLSVCVVGVDEAGGCPSPFGARGLSSCSSGGTGGADV